MILFSKRNEQKFISSRMKKIYSSLLKSNIRRRLEVEMKFLTSSDYYVERFLLKFDKNHNSFRLNGARLDELTARELGYSMSNFINIDNLLSRSSEYGDFGLFDLVELLVIFSQNDKRSILIERINRILAEEGSGFEIQKNIIVDTRANDLKSTVSLIKEPLLKRKLEEFYGLVHGGEINYVTMAKISADIVQLIFSSPADGDNKKHSDDLCKKIADIWTDDSHKEKFSQLLSETVVRAKALYNDIEDIRHSDRSTIPVHTPSIYKMIAHNNIDIAEVAILSLPDLFIIRQNPEEIKDAYLSQYEINKDEFDVVEEITIEDIPF